MTHKVSVVDILNLLPYELKNVKTESQDKFQLKLESFMATQSNMNNLLKGIYMKTNNQNKSIICEVCQATFTSLDSLKRHMLSRICQREK